MPGRLDVVHREGDVVDAVAVRADVLGDLAVGGQRRREHEPDVVLDHDVARPVTDLGLEATEGDRREAPQRPVVGRRLAGVADPELDVVDALERQEVGRLVVGVLVDPGARLVGGSGRDGLRHRGSPLLAAGRPVAVGRAAAAGGRGLQCYASRATLGGWTTPLLERLQAARDGLAATRPAVEAGAPWPMAAVYDDSDEARWGPGEVLAHLAEMAQYWLGEIERVLAGATEPVPFGRISTDPVRIGVVGRDRSLPPRELYDRIDDALTRFDRRWRDADSGRARAARAPPDPRRVHRRGRCPTGSSSATSPSTSTQIETILGDSGSAG